MSRSAVSIILGAELLAWRNRVVKGHSSRAIALTLALALGAIVLGGTVFGLAGAAAQFLPYARDPMLAGAFTVLSILMLIVGFPTVIANFFVGTDLLQLVLAPVRPIDIFLARSVLAMRANLLLGYVIAAFVAGVGAGSGAGPIYYPVGMLMVALQVLVVTALQAILMSAVVRFVPARIARDAAVAVASISGAAIYLLWQVTLRQTIGRRADVSGLVAFARRVDWMPSAWPGHALSSLLAGASGEALLWLAVTAAFSAALIGCAATLYGSTLLAGLGQFGAAPARWRARPAGRRRPDAARGGSSPELAIARKDWLTYRRDVKRLSRLVPAVIFLIGYAVLLNRPQRGLSSFWNDVFVVAFVSMFVAMAVATSAVPSERRGFLLLRMAPIKPWHVLRAKIGLTMLPLVALAVLVDLIVGIIGANGPSELLQLLVLAVWLGFGFVAIGVSAGAIDPRFDSVDDRRMVGPLGTLVGLGAELGFGVLSVLAFATLHFAGQVYGGGVQIADYRFAPAFAFGFAGFAILLAACAAAVVGYLLRTAARRLSSFEVAIVTS